MINPLSLIFPKNTGHRPCPGFVTHCALTALVFICVSAVFPTLARADLLDIFNSKSLTDGSRYAFVPAAAKASVLAIDTKKHEMAAELDIEHIPGSVAVSEKLDRLFVTDPDNHLVTIIDLGSREVVEQLAIGMRPDAVLVNPYDRYVAFGSRDGSVSVWDMQTLKQMLRVDGLGSAVNITFGFDGRNLYSVDEKTKTISVIEMHSRDKVAEIKLGGPDDLDAEVSAISRSVDGFTGFVSITSENRLVVIDLIDWKVKKSIPTGKEPVRPYSTADNRYILVPHRAGKSLTVLSSLSHQVIATIPTEVEAKEINTGWLDTVAFIMPHEGSRLSVVDLDALKQTGFIELSGRPDNGLVTSDSKLLYTALTDNGSVAAIDARARRLITTIKTTAGGLKGMEIAVSNNVCH